MSHIKSDVEFWISMGLGIIAGIIFSVPIIVILLYIPFVMSSVHSDTVQEIIDKAHKDERLMNLVQDIASDGKITIWEHRRFLRLEEEINLQEAFEKLENQ